MRSVRSRTRSGVTRNPSPGRMGSLRSLMRGYGVDAPAWLRSPSTRVQPTTSVATWPSAASNARLTAPTSVADAGAVARNARLATTWLLRADTSLAPTSTTAAPGDAGDPAAVLERAQQRVLQQVGRRLGPDRALVDLQFARYRPHHDPRRVEQFGGMRARDLQLPGHRRPRRIGLDAGFRRVERDRLLFRQDAAARQHHPQCKAKSPSNPSGADAVSLALHGRGTGRAAARERARVRRHRHRLSSRRPLRHRAHSGSNSFGCWRPST